MAISVRVNFNDSVYNYDFLNVQSVSDPKEGMKATVVEGTRSDGILIIPGGKKSQEIIVKGIVTGIDFPAIMTAVNTLKTSVTTDIATLTLKHNIGAGWVTQWAYTVRRINEISFPDSMRISSQEYSVPFLILSY